MTGSAISTLELSKHFGPVIAVDQLSFEVAPGEVFGFLGPNGSGKSTTIRMLLDLVRPTSGQACLFGEDVRNRPDLRQELGYLPSEQWFPPHRRVCDYLDDLDALRGSSGPDRAALVDRFDVDPRRRLGVLSTGQRQKVGVVAALMHRPRVVLLDEPSRGLDPLVQLELRHLIREQGDEGVAVLLSSHSLAEVEDVVDRVGILRRGAFQVVADLDDLRRCAPATLVVEYRDAPPAESVAALARAHRVDLDHRRLSVHVVGAVDDALRAILELGPVETVHTTADGLEELFLRFYSGDTAPTAPHLVVAP